MKNENNIQNSKILVTGGAGFIGSHLVDSLLSQDYEVRVIDNLINGTKENLEDAFKNQTFKFIEGDILDNKLCQKSLMNIDIVFHLACLGVRHSLHNPFENHRVNTEGTFNVLRASLDSKVKKFFYISSSEIYGKVKTFPISENSIPEPTTIYAASKLAGEAYSKAFYESFGLNVTILRLFNNYGPRAHYEGDAGELIPRAIVNILYGKSPVIFGDGLISKDFLYVEDTARVLADLLNLNDITGETYNVGFGKEITVTKLIEMILKIMDKGDINIKYLESRPADVPRLLVDSSKLKEKMNYNTTSLKEGLLDTINYYKELSLTKNLLKAIPEINWR